jgi:hypothetical protein
MSARDRIRGLLLILVVLIGAKAVHQTYRWFAFGAERAQLQEMRERVADAGVEVVRTAAKADTLHRQIKQMDHDLEARQRAVDRYNRYARDGTLGAHLYDSYRADLDGYNARVMERNARVEEWEGVIARNREAVNRYNLLADSIRAVAARIGDPYFPIPLPVEAAVERGLLQIEEKGNSG